MGEDIIQYRSLMSFSDLQSSFLYYNKLIHVLLKRVHPKLIDISIETKKKKINKEKH